jgi:phosphoenolpyruvate phosphomutase
VVDLAWLDQEQRSAQPVHLNPDLVSLADPPGKTYLSRFVMPEGEHRVVKIGQHLPREQAHGEFIGMAMFSERGTQALRDCYRAAQGRSGSAGFHESPNVAKASFTDLLQDMIDRGHTVQAIPIFKGWMEVDSFEEYQKAWAKIRQ